MSLVKIFIQEEINEQAFILSIEQLKGEKPTWLAGVETVLANNKEQIVGYMTTLWESLIYSQIPSQELKNIDWAALRQDIKRAASRVFDGVVKELPTALHHIWSSYIPQSLLSDPSAVVAQYVAQFAAEQDYLRQHKDKLKGILTFLYIARLLASCTLFLCTVEYLLYRTGGLKLRRDLSVLDTLKEILSEDDSTFTDSIRAVLGRALATRIEASSPTEPSAQQEKTPVDVVRLGNFVSVPSLFSTSQDVEHETGSSFLYYVHVPLYQRSLLPPGVGSAAEADTIRRIANALEKYYKGSSTLSEEEKRLVDAFLKGEWSQLGLDQWIIPQSVVHLWSPMGESPGGAVIIPLREHKEEERKGLLSGTRTMLQLVTCLNLFQNKLPYSKRINLDQETELALHLSLLRPEEMAEPQAFPFLTVAASSNDDEVLKTSLLDLFKYKWEVPGSIAPTEGIVGILGRYNKLVTKGQPQGLDFRNMLGLSWEFGPHRCKLDLEVTVNKYSAILGSGEVTLSLACKEGKIGAKLTVSLKTESKIRGRIKDIEKKTNIGITIEQMATARAKEEKVTHEFPQLPIEEFLRQGQKFWDEVNATVERIVVEMMKSPKHMQDILAFRLLWRTMNVANPRIIYEKLFPTIEPRILDTPLYAELELDDKEKRKVRLKEVNFNGGELRTVWVGVRAGTVVEATFLAKVSNIHFKVTPLTEQVMQVVMSGMIEVYEVTEQQEQLLLQERHETQISLPSSESPEWCRSRLWLLFFDEFLDETKVRVGWAFRQRVAERATPQQGLLKGGGRW